MAANYFTPENAWRHLFFIRGLTGDEFYTDGGLKLDIEQLLQMELKRSSYERIVFYDKKKKLYCYDDHSYDLLLVNGSSRRKSGASGSLIRPSSKGLKKGKFGKKAAAQEDTPQTAPESAPEAPESPWVPGRHSGLPILRTQEGQLHLGVQDKDFVLRQIDAYMNDIHIKTAVVINDPADFLLYFGNDPMHGLTAVYERMTSDNENIMIFVYTDAALGNLYEAQQMEDTAKDINDIVISCPNAVELRNMLSYCRIRNGLNIRLRDLDHAALALRRAMSLGEKPIRIKEVHARLQSFGAEQRLTPDGCFALLGVPKPVPADRQLQEMIGMEDLKRQLLAYRKGDTDPLKQMQYLTASRLQEDLPRPQKKDQMIHFVLTGNPGTGKTTVARLIGQLFYELGYLESGHLVETDRSQMVSNHVGETAIWTRNRVMEAMGGVLFIDEAYTLKRSRDNDADFGQEAIDTLVKLMDQYKGRFILVAAGYQREMEVFLQSNPGLPSRFHALHIDDYTPEEMRQILEYTARKDGITFSGEFQAALPNFCENWVNLAGEGWGNGREAENLLAAMATAWSRDPSAVSVTDPEGRTLRCFESRHLPQALQQNLIPVSQMRAESLRRLNGMTGLQGVKAQIEKLRLRMLSGDMQEPGHYVFTGAPGTGKTTVARRMGEILRNLGLLKRGHLVEYTASKLINDVYGPDHHGNFEATVQSAMDGVLFIDEAHQLGDREDSRGKLIINAMVPFMENARKNICIILAGYEDEMYEMMKEDPGLQSRITDIIDFENYSGQELQGILLDMLHSRGIETTEEYRELSLRALTRYQELHGRDKDFGNARYVRKSYIPASLDAQTRRLIRKYNSEDFPREEKKLLTGEDIPAELVRLTKTPLSKPDNRSALEKLDDLIGYESIKAELRRLLQTARFNQNNEMGVSGMPERLHWVLEGNPGTGKTTIARLIGQVYREAGILPRGHTLKVTRADLVGEYQGQTARHTRRCIEKAMGGVLFIDEAYMLTRVEGGEGGYGQEAVGELVEAMEALNGEFAVVAAGYPADMEDFLKANSGLSSRMKKFVLEDYKPEELAKIFLLKCRQQKVVLSESLEQKLPLFFGNMKKRESTFRDWGNAREAENLLRDMLHEWMNDPRYTKDDEGQTLRLMTEDQVPEAMKRYLKGKLPTAQKEESALDQLHKLIGFDEIKARLQELLELGQISREQDMEDLLSGLNYHWVLRGNPGTGKTTVAELVGKVYKEMGLLSRGHTVKVTRADLVAPYEGQTAPRTRKCIEQAMGGVLFIDEAYTLKRSDSGGVDFGQEAIDTLLEQMSAKNGEFAVIVAGYPREMDTFLNSNPGLTSRFGEDFTLADYTAEELARIFQFKCRQSGFRIEEDLLEALEPMFHRMIRARLKGWANGRMAERLEQELRKVWPKAPIIRVDADGGKQRYYALQHLPDKYRQYLSPEDIGSEPVPGSAESPIPARNLPSHVTRNWDRIPHSKLAAPMDGYRYEKDFMDQTRAVVLIHTRVERTYGFGSGSILTSDGYILTCNHVIRNKDSIHVRLRLSEDGPPLWEPAELVWTDEHLDVAILKIRDGNYPTLSLWPQGKKIPIGEAIYIWGYPFGSVLSDDLNELTPSLFQGNVSSIQIKDGRTVVNTDMQAKQGNSGGPVFSKTDGTIMGILCGSVTQGSKGGLIEEINYILPVSYIWENVVEKPKTVPEKTPADAATE